MKPRGCRIGGLLLLLLSACIVVLLTGCQTTVQTAVKRSLTSEEVQAIQTGQKSVVLFRLTSTEGKDQESLDHLMDVRWNIWNVNNWQDRQLLVKPKDSAPSLYWRVPSEELGRAGWRYLVLVPGRYFMKVRPDEGMAETFPVYHVSVPPRPGPVYAGSFRFMPTNAIFRVSRGMPKTYPGFEFIGMSDESIAAREVGTNLPSSLGSVTTSLAVPNDLATALQPYSGRRILSVEATNRPVHATKYVGHKAGVIVGAPFAFSGALLLCVGDVDPVFAVGGVALLAAAVPVAYLGDATFGSISRMNWKPHQAALNETINEFNLARHLTNSLQQALSGTHSIGLNETNAGAGFVVCLDVYRIGLEPTEYLALDYTFEVEVYLSITEAASNTVIWEHGYVYCHAGLKRKKVPFATFVKNADKASSLKTYQGQPGRQQVQEQLEETATRLSAEMAADLKAAGF